MFASKSERKVHYSIRKFSVGVASVVVASLFLGGVVHAEGVRSGDTPRLHLVGKIYRRSMLMKSSRI
ncbi:TPA: YSIRK-type signal peptide-containing protein [Streptococcus pneumoniae]